MFTKPTLLILGSGASCEYGYPLGEELIDKILENRDEILQQYKSIALPNYFLSEEAREIDKNFSRIQRILYGVDLDVFKSDITARKFDEVIGYRSDFGTHEENLRALFNEAPLSSESIEQFLNLSRKNLTQPQDSLNVKILLENIKKNLDAFNKYILALLFFKRLQEFDPISIDFFLSVHTEFQYPKETPKENQTNIGKFAIAHEILKIKHKLSENSYKKINSGNLVSAKKNANWYKYLLNEMLKGCEGANQKAILNNKLSIITFNYDSSLESFLETRLQNMSYFKEEIDEENYAKKYLNELKEDIFHVYGEIKESKDQDVFKGWQDAQYIEEQGKKIRVINEDRKEDEKIKEKLEEMIKNAQRVFILGYGFDKTNNQKIGLKNIFTLNTQVVQDQKKEYPPLYNLEKEVFVINLNDSEIINKTIKEFIYGSEGDELVYKKWGWINAQSINLNEIKNLTISNKPLSKAIKNDFNFSDSQ